MRVRGWALIILTLILPQATGAMGPTLPRDYRAKCGDWVRFLSPSQLEALMEDYDRALVLYFPKVIGSTESLRAFARAYKNLVMNHEKIRNLQEAEEVRRETAHFFSRAGKGARILKDYSTAGLLYAFSAFFYETLGTQSENAAKESYELAAFSYERASEMHGDDEFAAIAAIFYEWVGLNSKAHLLRVHLLFPERIDQLKRGMYDPPRWAGRGFESERKAPPPKTQEDSRTNSELLRVLNLSDGATSAEIKSARNRESVKYHSDLHPHLSDDEKKVMDSKFRDITNAFQELRKRGLVI